MNFGQATLRMMQFFERVKDASEVCTGRTCPPTWATLLTLSSCAERVLFRLPAAGIGVLPRPGGAGVDVDWSGNQRIL
jgi:hypothetical protein